ncbi:MULTISPECIES: asparaginase [unclassified Delftia]|uniref:asparaginase n=1 Tax=unclassified Delftia TaxID=2613839 RepID=UPI0019016611|nr:MULTISPECIES: asparaginase [unclassified Delftia]MBK0113506.1 asparaginase [Delftia sp. S65]MBK0120473.1 asparaginase [Delftia sp. S67]MBK0130920.1 asparaginase [Delftia sp. S66]
MGQSKLVILGTGGTIAGRADSQSQGVGYKAGQITVQSLLEAVPDLEQQALGPVQTQQIAQVDSKDMDWPVWRALLRACMQALEDADTRAVVITHGTDTLEETAWLLHSLLPATKPIVLTCAMRPATALLADGPQNLRDAVTVAASGGRSGVWVVAGGEVHAAAQVQKVHPYRLQAMRSVEGGPQALVEEGRVRWLVPDAPSSPAAPSTGAMVPATMSSDLLALDELPWVEVVFSGALARASGVDALVAAGVRGIVVAGTGNATVHEGMEAALQRARDKGVWIWRGTRCAEGLPVASGLGTNPAEADLAQLPVAKARIAMMLALAAQPRD